jgi:hypothetical protein
MPTNMKPKNNANNKKESECLAQNRQRYSWFPTSAYTDMLNSKIANYRSTISTFGNMTDDNKVNLTSSTVFLSNCILIIFEVRFTFQPFTYTTTNQFRRTAFSNIRSLKRIDHFCEKERWGFLK